MKAYLELLRRVRDIGARKAEALPCTYFHVTITVPEELRERCGPTRRTAMRC